MLKHHLFDADVQQGGSGGDFGDILTNYPNSVDKALEWCSANNECRGIAVFGDDSGSKFSAPPRVSGWVQQIDNKMPILMDGIQNDSIYTSYYKFSSDIPESLLPLVTMYPENGQPDTTMPSLPPTPASPSPQPDEAQNNQ